jgi:hypothetical protein
MGLIEVFALPRRMYLDFGPLCRRAPDVGVTPRRFAALAHEFVESVFYPINPKLPN